MTRLRARVLLYHRWLEKRKAGIMTIDSFNDFVTICLELGFDENMKIYRLDSKKPYTKDNMYVGHNRKNLSTARGNSKYTGVLEFKKGNYHRWRASIEHNGKRVHLGYYKSPEEGALARNRYIDEHNLPYIKAVIK